MKATELRDLDVDDLIKKERELAEELFKLRFQHNIRPLENTARLRQLRKERARVKTIIGQKSTAR